MAFGILACGAYIPRLRLSRHAIADANSWFAPALKALAKGERAMCNWDEDPVTMAVEATRDALVGRDRSAVQALHFASTTFPFLERSNAGVVAAALGMPDEISTLDVATSQRAATSALLTALSADRQTVIVSSEQRRVRAASPLEMTSGDGAAAVLVGEGDPLARLVASSHSTADFVDSYRTAESVYDYLWEERWVRDAGYITIVPPVIARCLERAGLGAAEVTHFCMATGVQRVAKLIAKRCGIPEETVVDGYQAVCGDTGAAHPLLMLIGALENTKPGDRILLVGFGQGADALLFECTKRLDPLSGRLGVKGSLARRQEENNYSKFLAFNNTIELERGMRAETDKLTPLSALWRNREAVTSFVGGKCRICGTAQFPKSRVCVNPNCNAMDSQESYPYAERVGRVNSYTADRLTYSPDPPACYGMIQFEEGGRWMMDFTDLEADELAVGRAMRMVFRIKDIDTQRGFRRYFWKAAPAAATQEGR